VEKQKCNPFIRNTKRKQTVFLRNYLKFSSKKEISPQIIIINGMAMLNGKAFNSDKFK